MKLKTILSITIYYSVVSLGSSLSTGGEHKIGHGWGYEEDNGPDSWGGLCQTGKQQSPIDIKTSQTEQTVFKPLELDGYDVDRTLNVQNNGHTVVLTIDDTDSAISVRGGGFDEDYQLQQLHFHWDSEHTVDGKRYDLELHLVHFNTKYGDFAEAAKNEDGLAVIGVLFEESEEASTEVTNLFSDIFYTLKIKSREEQIDGDKDGIKDEDKIQHVEQHDDDEDSVSVLTNQHNLRDFLPHDISSWFRYQGSLTTPTCDEVVTWTVFQSVVLVSKQVLDNLRIIPAPTGLMASNYRPPQPLNDRLVYHQTNHSSPTIDQVDDNDVNDDDNDDEKLQQINSSNQLFNGLHCTVLSLALYISCLIL